MEEQQKSASQVEFLRHYPDVLDVKQLAELLQISTKTVYRLVSDGKIKSMKIGREHRFPKPYIFEFLTCCEKD